MSCFNDNTVYVIINLFVLVMKKSIPVKRAFFKEKLPFFFTYPTRKVNNVIFQIIISTIYRITLSFNKFMLIY